MVVINFTCRIRLIFAEENKMTPNDLLELYGGPNRTVSMLWTVIDRYDYTNNLAPTFELYTGLTIKNTFRKGVTTILLYLMLSYLERNKI